MFYTIKHLTQFHYSSPVSEGIMEARMCPRTEGAQRCLYFDLQTNPKATVLSYLEHPGNLVHHFNIPRRHGELAVQAMSLVQVDEESFAAGQPQSQATWSQLDAAVVAGDYWEYLVPSRFAEPSALLRELAKELKATRVGEPLAMLSRLNAELGEFIEYSPAITQADSVIDEALAARKGVCQDFAHILIALLRELGVPARYVSGYLYRRDEGSRGSPQDGATHAWVEAFLPDCGWVGLDPSNGAFAGAEHLRVAVGRDYADVPPTKGVFKGQAESEVLVRVEVQQLEQAPRLSLEQPPPLLGRVEQFLLPHTELVRAEEVSADFVLQSYRAHRLQQQQGKSGAVAGDWSSCA